MNLRKLYEHLDHDIRNVVQATADKAAREARTAITVEQFLLTLLRDRTSGPGISKALEAAGCDVPAMETALANLVKNEERGIAGTLPRFGETLARLLGEAWDLAFGDYGEARVGSIRIFETLARRSEMWPQLATALPGLASLDLATFAASGRALEAQSGGDHAPAATDTQYPELSRYGSDMVSAARSEGFDPVVGLHGQMQAIAAILLRRKQNSVAVVGESGVGKSACILGFVNALANREAPVPQVLHDTPVWSLDLSALRAGAVVRGVLEERLQAITKEVAGSGMILLLDDLHLLFGEQGGGADALRAVLGDSSVRILASCGWREWRRYVEPDAGLARRIASVRIQEPDDEEALRIVAGLAPALAKHHSVEYEEQVLDSAVALSRRYIVGRQLPDKAIVVLDSACARARMSPEHEPQEASQASDKPGDDDAAQEADVVGEADEVGEASAVGEAGGDSVREAGGDTMEENQSSTVLVTEDHVASVVSDLTGVPVGSMLSDVSKMSTRLEQILGERVVGQDSALARCASQARAYLAGLSDRRRPVGALMFCGPSGVGKTETAHALADSLFGGRILTINMSEYQEAHTVSGLKGAPAGYVGYGEGGVLTEGIRRTPYCVVLLDEIEKAHGDVIEMLYQVLDRGWMEDAEGIEADFSNALIVLTSNAGDTVLEEAAASEKPLPENTLQQVLAKALGKHFPAAFIGRLQLVPYWPLGEETLASIAAMRLDRLAETYQASHRSTLEFSPEVLEWLVGHVRSTPQGARFLDGIVARSIRPVIAERVLSRIGEGLMPGDLRLCMEDDGFTVQEIEAGS